MKTKKLVRKEKIQQGVISSHNIFIHGAKVHNLKNVSVEIPRNKLIVVTGVSGSGKSSLTIYALCRRTKIE